MFVEQEVDVVDDANGREDRNVDDMTEDDDDAVDVVAWRRGMTNAVLLLQWRTCCSNDCCGCYNQRQS